LIRPTAAAACDCGQCHVVSVRRLLNTDLFCYARPTKVKSIADKLELKTPSHVRATFCRNCGAEYTARWKRFFVFSEHTENVERPGLFEGAYVQRSPDPSVF